MKIKILNEGIYNGTRNDILNTKEDLSSAKNVTLDCPSNFRYAGDIRGIKSEIQGILNRLQRLNDGLYRIDSNYRQLDTQEVKNVRRLKDSSLKERRGL